ncbi:MAG: biotin synthase [Burkholderiales bacterium]|nr:biotin synthase [Burkholderiales bacterium]
MNTERPPTIDPQAAKRWSHHLPAQSPWLHEEVARRMEERLQCIVKQPTSWLHWAPLQGGMQAQALLTQRYPHAICHVHETDAIQTQALRKAWTAPWWKPARWSGVQAQFAAPTQQVEMLWANMALHMHADPQALIAQWLDLLAVDGFLMFSCLGPDTLRELRRVYSAQGWEPPCHEFTDMHDWGDMLVHAGYGEPVMDMERITLTFSSAKALLTELRGLGRNLHAQRFAGLRGRRWHAQLQSQIDAGLRRGGPEGRLELTFEVVYGHAFKPAPRLTVGRESSISLEQMRQTLAAGKSRGGLSG